MDHDLSLWLRTSGFYSLQPSAFGCQLSAVVGDEARQMGFERLLRRRE
jgi:hypothetical protein